MQETEDSFRSSLQDVSLVIERLAPYCKSITELVEMVHAADASSGVLRMIMKAVMEQKR